MKRDQPSRKPGRPQGPATDELAAARAEAWRLRVDERRTFADIGLLMGCSTATAQRMVRAVLSEVVPSADEIEMYRRSLTAEALSRAELAFERADELWEMGRAQELILEGSRGGPVVSPLAPALFGRAVQWERAGIHHLDRVAKWSGVEAAVAAAQVDVEGVEAEVSAEAERFLAVLAEVERKRASVADRAGVVAEGSGSGENAG